MITLIPLPKNYIVLPFNKELSDADIALLDKCLANYDDSEPIVKRYPGRPVLQKVHKVEGEELSREDNA